ncbi:MAG TPA: hypothetical protein VF463_13985 [Sphingobium sp.]
MKFRASIAMLSIAAAAPTAVLAQAAPAASAAAAKATGYTVADTDIGTLLDDPASKAIIDKYVPGFSANPQIDMARSMTLKMVQQYSSDTLTDPALANIQNDLNKLPRK